MHGQLPHKIHKKLVGNERSYQWWKSGDIKGETESTVVAAQDHAFSTNYFKNKFWRKKLTVNASYVNIMKKELPPNHMMPHFDEE